MTEFCDKTVVMYYGNNEEHLVIFDSQEDYIRAEELREDFLDVCDKEVDEGHEDRFGWASLVDYWSLHGIIFTEVYVDYVHDLYGR